MPEVMDRMEALYGGMSKSQKRIVHFLKDHQQDLAFEPLARFAEKTGSSEATVVRFARALGYTGFADMQKSLREALVAMAKGPDPIPPPGDDDFTACAQVAHQAMVDTYAALDMEALRESCRMLMEAKRVLVIGYMDSFGVAAQALHMLDTIRPNVEFSRLLFETNIFYRHLHPGTAVLAVSFEPHYKFSHELVQMARQRKCDIVLMTDSTLNPLALLADRVLCAKPVHYKGNSLIDMSAPMHLLTMMVRYMAEHWPDQVDHYMATSLRIHEEYLE